MHPQMMMTIANNLKTFLVALFSVLFVGQTYADKTVEDLAGEDRVMYDKFRDLLTNGAPEEFYAFADKYAQDLHEKASMPCVRIRSIRPLSLPDNSILR